MQDSQRQNLASLLPVITDFDKPFWDGLSRQELLIQKCNVCGNTQFPDSPVCTNCLSSDVFWTPCAGKATLWAKVVFHKAYLEPYPDVPYPVVIAKLEEGHIITGRISPENAAKVSYDDPLQVSFCRTMDGTVLVEFVPEEAHS